PYPLFKWCQNNLTQSRWYREIQVFRPFVKKDGVLFLFLLRRIQSMVEQKNDFTEWYLQTVQKAELMSYSPVRGSIIFRPDGFELWEHIQEEFNKFLRSEGIRNAYFPMLIPKSFFMKEADHIEGFAPELPWVTEVGDEKLEEPLALRPTSVTMIGSAFTDWINSYRDLP